MSRKLTFNAIKLIFLGGFYLFLLVLYATAAPAQDSAVPDRVAAAEQIRAMADELDLTDDQRQAVIPILQQYGQATKAILEKHGVDPASGKRPPLRKMMAIRGDMEKNRTSLDQQLAAVLSPTQMDTFRKLQKQQREAIRARMTNSN
ncbi:hypothetical protein [Hoeflea sp.]|uniref:hypothetical protein n=1 Tax=Hoeflea sp. TaxID=1940281 RepID=UPI003B01CEB1